ncbi:MAG: hypothetical protein WHS46_05025 [Desulfosoma sp.]
MCQKASSSLNAGIPRCFHALTPRRARGLLRKLRNPLFPLYFLERNLGMLKSENGVAGTSTRRAAQWMTVICERIQWVDELLRAQKSVSPALGASASRSRLDNGPDRSRIETYCNHCGLCCEICSGFPDFPDPENPPHIWQFVFGQGLGYGHRFCPFLMHDRRGGHSFCAIHRYRPNPCRIFEEDECQTVKNELKRELARTHGRPPRSSVKIGRLIGRVLKNGRTYRLLPHEE